MAGASHGVVTRAQLLAAGVTREAIRTRLLQGSLLREHPGVYRVGHRAPSVEARYLAAVRACGEGALLRGRAAAYLFAVLRGVTRAPQPEIMTLTRRRVTGVRVHRTRQLDPRDRTMCRRIPVTTLPRPLVDLAGVLEADALARICHEAQVRHRMKPEGVEAVLARRPNSPGAATLRAILCGERPVSLSRLETLFLQRLRGAGLPLPQTNRPAGAHRVDCRWPQHRLTVELDSYRYHHTRYAWGEDHRRDREAYARGDDIRRYTWEDVDAHPGPMLTELRVAGRPALGAALVPSAPGEAQAASRARPPEGRSPS